MARIIQAVKSFRASRLRHWRSSARAFTLVELLMATTILVLILTLTLQITNSTSNLWKHTREKIDAFQEARAGFESMTRNLSQAMLNTYWGYDNANAPTIYQRQSELQFITGLASGTSNIIASTANSNSTTTPIHFTTHAVFFQAPLGYSSNTTSTASLPNLLNICGYFVEFSSDQTDRPVFLQSATTLPYRFRFRLKQLMMPTESFGVYASITNPLAYGATLPNYWFNLPLIPPSGYDVNFNTLPSSPKLMLAENVIALVILPQRSPNDPIPTGAPAELAPNYAYNSRLGDPPNATPVANSLAAVTCNQLPPVVQITMVAIDEASAARVQAQNQSGSTVTMPTFADSTYLPGGLSSIFQVADNYSTDLANLQQALTRQHISYRVFTTNVSILQAKWSN